jgi:hypothetical protein
MRCSAVFDILSVDFEGLNGRREREDVLRMAVEFTPWSRGKEAPPYRLLAYGENGKVVLASTFNELDELFEALRLAGISLQRDEEKSLIRDEAYEQPYVLIPSNVELHESQFSILRLIPVI